MEVVIEKTPDAVAQRGADYVCNLLKRKPSAVLGLATGGTPLALYEELIRRNKAGEISFKDVVSFNLDEYLGIDPKHPQSYHYYMYENFFKHIDIKMENTHVPNPLAKNPMNAGSEYEELIEQAGGIDLQILGIGRNSHIGFNEPSSSLGSRTRLKELTQMTMNDNARFFGPDEVQPDVAITMGIGTIMESRRIVLLANGWQKAKAIADTVEGSVSAMVPASILQMHPNASVIVDEVAANQLTMQDYYKRMLESQDEMTDKFGDPR